jgi:hypothetical protein
VRTAQSAKHSEKKELNKKLGKLQQRKLPQRNKTKPQRPSEPESKLQTAQKRLGSYLTYLLSFLTAVGRPTKSTESAKAAVSASLGRATPDGYSSVSIATKDTICIALPGHSSVYAMGQS